MLLLWSLRLWSTTSVRQVQVSLQILTSKIFYFVFFSTKIYSLSGLHIYSCSTFIMQECLIYIYWKSLFSKLFLKGFHSKKSKFKWVLVNEYPEITFLKVTATWLRIALFNHFENSKPFINFFSPINMKLLCTFNKKLTEKLSVNEDVGSIWEHYN